MFDFPEFSYYNHRKPTDCEHAMKKTVLFILFFLLLSGCSTPQTAQNTEVTASVPVTVVTEPVPVVTEPVPVVTEPESTISTEPAAPVLSLTEEEQTMLLKIGMAERGDTECTECIALVMRTVLNRVEAGRFGSSIRSVLFAQDQFTPISDGSYYSAEPNAACSGALEMIIYGWDESQGALFYEWCTGESWHSKNSHLLFQHCDVRFYN